MKILMITMAMNIGGAETQILELSRELMSRGHEVTLASNGGVYADELAKYSAKIVKLPLHNKKPASVIKSWRGLEKLLRENEYDIVHAHARIPAFIAGRLNRYVTRDNVKFRLVTTTHLNFTVNPLWRKIACWGENTMAVSDDIADYLVREYNYPREHIYTTINGIDTEKFSPKISPDSVIKKHSLNRGNLRVVYMSRLDPDRAEPAYRVIEAADELAESRPNLDFVIVGGGGCFDELNDLADKVNKKHGRNLVIMTGGVANTNEYCALADIFIGVSRSALEAMAEEKTLILAGGQGGLGIFDESKLDDAVKTNFCCRGCEMMTTEQLRNAIVELAENEELRQKLGKYNRELILKSYTAKRMTDDYVKMYKDTLSSPVRFKGAPDITVSGYYGFGNLGDETLLRTISENAAKLIPGIKIAALTKNGNKDEQKTGLKCVKRMDFLRAAILIKNSRALVFGGGSLLQDKTSSRSLRYYLWVLKTAQVMGTKTYIYANGIGPLTNAKNREKTARILAKADVISVRDSESKRELEALFEQIGVKKDVYFTADPTFLTENGETAAFDSEKSNDKYIVVSLRPADTSSSADIEKLSDSDENTLAQTLEAVSNAAKKYNYTVYAVPMQLPHDEVITKNFVEGLRNRGIRAEMYIPETADKLKSLLQTADLVVGMRLHSVIFASSVAVPVIALEYDKKLGSFMRDLGQGYSIKIDGKFAKELESAIDEVNGKREEVIGSLNTRREECREVAKVDLERLRDLIGM